MPADVRVGIVSWNTEADLRRCLAALPAALGALAAEVVVVDNASTDGSATTAGELGARVIRNDRNLGYAVAMNQALAGTEAPVLLALNPDTEPAPGSLERLVAALGVHTDAGVAVPRLVGVDGRPQHSAYRFPTAVPSLAASVSVAPLRASALGRRLLLEGSGPHAEGEVPWAIGAVHAIRAAALDGEAPYAERSFMYAEDLDLCWRLAQAGRPTWLVADVEVLHVGNVAGAQAWGSDRSLRYWAATYDVVAQRRSGAAARRLGAGAALASTIAATRAAVRSVLGGRTRRAERRSVARQLVHEARFHARVLRQGPPPPDRTPPG
jgi:GT2 family glycosyltransferase